MRLARCLCLIVVFSFLGGISTDNQSAAQKPTEPAFVLLYSTIGYERAATKQALLRAIRPELNRPDAIDLATSSASLTTGDIVQRRYPVQYAGKTFGSHWWQVDFSSFDRSGHDFWLNVELKLVDREDELQLRSDAFAIDDDILFRNTFPGLALANARARKAPATTGGGYFDCNTRMGEAYSHAMFAAGLLAVLERRSSALDVATQRKLVEFAEIALDYVVHLQQKDGHIVDQDPSRPFQGFNPGLVNTTLGIYGLVHGALVLRQFDAEKAKRYLQAAEKAFDYLRLRKSDTDMITLATLLYRASGDTNYLKEAASYARFSAHDPALLTPGERSLEALPYNEGLLELTELAPEHPDRIQWAHQLLDRGIQLYREAASQNVFHICPWDNVGQALPELIPFDSCRTSHFSRVAYSTLRLAELFPASVWEPTATASLQWVAGLNYGLPGNRVIPASPNPVEAASFIVNMGVRYAKQLTAELQWQAPTIVNGFTDGFRYENRWQAAETFILHDGLWLMALSRYGALPTLTVHTTSDGKPCPAKYRVRVGGKTVRGTTERDTGKAQIILPAWGEAELVLSDAGRQIRVPFYASMGTRIMQRVDLQEHLLVSMQPARIESAPPFEVLLEVRNSGRRPTRARIQLQADGAVLEGSAVSLLALQGGETRSLLFRFTPVSPTYLLMARVYWEHGRQWACVYGAANGAMLPISMAVRW